MNCHKVKQTVRIISNVGWQYASKHSPSGSGCIGVAYIHRGLEQVYLIRHAWRYVVCISGLPPAVPGAEHGETDNLGWLGSSLILNSLI